MRRKKILVKKVYKDEKIWLFPIDLINIKYRIDEGCHVHRWVSVGGGMPLCLCGLTLPGYLKKNKFGEFGKELKFDLVKL